MTTTLLLLGLDEKNTKGTVIPRTIRDSVYIAAEDWNVYCLEKIYRHSSDMHYLVGTKHH